VLALASGAVAMEGPTDYVLDSAEFRATMMGDASGRDQEVATTDV
jgi:hypothetical protein